MTMNQVGEQTSRPPLRLWPGVAAAVLMVLARVVTPLVFPEAGAVGVIAGAAGAFVILVWWLLFSRAPWSERAAAIGLMVVAVALTSQVVHPSVSNGFMGRMLPIFATPVMCLALVAWAVASRGFSSGMRFTSMAATILLACGALALIRTGGITGGAESDLHWRWTPTPEDRLLAQGDEALVPPPSPGTTTRPETPAAPEPAVEPAPSASAPAIAKAPEAPAAVAASEPVASDRGANAPRANPVAVNSSAEWPGFRGPNRDSVVPGVRIDTDWSQKPPVELWRRPVGPGWSSFAVHGDLDLHAGAAWRRRSGLLLPLEQRRAGVAAQGPGALLGVEWRRGAARHAHPARRPRLHDGRDRHRQRARREHRCGASGREMRRPIPARRCRTGASPAHRW